MSHRLIPSGVVRCFADLDNRKILPLNNSNTRLGMMVIAELKNDFQQYNSHIDFTVAWSRDGIQAEAGYPYSSRTFKVVTGYHQISTGMSGHLERRDEPYILLIK